MTSMTATPTTSTGLYLGWTVAIRPNAKRGIFHRVDLALTWAQAVDLSIYIGRVMPGADVWYVLNAQADPTPEPITVDTGARIRIKDDGVLPFETANVSQGRLCSLIADPATLGQIVATMRNTHTLGNRVDFDALGIHYRTKITMGCWTIARVETRDRDGANLERVVNIQVNLFPNSLDRVVPEAANFLLYDGATGELLDDTDSMDALLATALVMVHSGPATVRQIECWS